MDRSCTSHYYDVTIPAGYKIAQSRDESVLNLGCIEIDVPPSPAVQRVTRDESFLSHLHQYPNPESPVSDKLIQLIADYTKLNRDHQDIVLTHGSDSALACILDSYFSQRGAKREPPIVIITLHQTYPHFQAFTEKYPYAIHRLFLFDNIQQIEAFLTEAQAEHDGCQIVYLPNPAMNGDYVETSVISSIVNKFEHTLFIVDEAYFEYNLLHYDNDLPVTVNQKLSTIGLVKSNLITIRTFSKCFALASLRVGYMVGSKSMISTLRRLINPKDVPEFSKSLCVTALEEKAYYLKSARTLLTKRLPLILARLPNAVKGITGPFFFLKFDSKKDLEEMCDKLLSEHNILIRNKHATMPLTARVTIPFLESTCLRFINAVISVKKYDIVLWDLDQTLRRTAQDKELKLPDGYSEEIGHHHYVVTNNTIDSDLNMIQKYLPFIEDVWKPDFERLRAAYGKNTTCISGPPLSLSEFYELAKEYTSSPSPPDILISDEHWASRWSHMSELKNVLPTSETLEIVLPDVRFYATWLRDRCKNKSWTTESRILYCGKDSVIGRFEIINWLHDKNIVNNRQPTIAVIGDADTDQKLSEALSADFKRIDLSSE